MAGFSSGEAIASGFRLIRENPGALLVWAGVYFVLGLLPQFAMLGLMWPDFMTLAQAGEAADPQLSPQQIMALNAKVSLFQPLQIVCSMAAVAVLYSAVFRAVLQPEDRGFGYVRFSRQELWLGLVLMIATVLLIIVIFLLMMPILFIGIFSAVTVSEGGEPSAPTVAVVLALAAAAFWLIAWLAIRLSLAYPMTFVERKFLFFEAWPLTKGHAWKIFLVMLAVVLIVFAAEMVLFAVVGIGVVATIFAGGEGLRQTFEQPQSDWLGWVAFWVVAGCVALSIFAAAAYAVMIAPLASIYRQLTAGALPATAP